MKEDLCTYEQAIKLKDMGFDEPCYNFWSLEPDGKPLVITSTLCIVRSSDLKGRDVTAPFLWQAQKWLREKGIHISVNPYCKVYNPNICDAEDCAWSFELHSVPFGRWLEKSKGEFDAYELALSAGIDAALELLTDKLNDK